MEEFDRWWDNHRVDFIEQYTINNCNNMKRIIKERIDAELTCLKGLVREMGKLNCTCPRVAIVGTTTDIEPQHTIGYDIRHNGNCILNRPEVRAILE